MPNQTNGLLKILRDNWFLVVAMVSLIGGWFTFNARLTVVEDSFADHCHNQKQLEMTIQEWRSEAREWKRDMVHLGEGLKRIEQTNDEILRRLP